MKKAVLWMAFLFEVNPTFAPMNDIRKNIRLMWIVTAAVLFVDQLSKVLSYLYLRETGEVNVLGSWFRLHYVENPGMAFGWQIGSEYGKILLTVLRLVLASGLGYYFIQQLKKPATRGAVICYALVFSGAIGNIIDCLFNGYFYGNGVYLETQPFFYPLGYGQVVDMLYFPIYQGTPADWIPFIGGKPFEFFEMVFNPADMAISIGVLLMIVFQRRFFSPVVETTEMHEE